MEELLKPAVLEILDHPAIVTCNVSSYNDIYITESRKILLDALAIACAIQHCIQVNLRLTRRSGSAGVAGSSYSCNVLFYLLAIYKASTDRFVPEADSRDHALHGEDAYKPPYVDCTFVVKILRLAAPNPIANATSNHRRSLR